MMEAAAMGRFESLLSKIGRPASSVFFIGVLIGAILPFSAAAQHPAGAVLVGAAAAVPDSRYGSPAGQTAEPSKRNQWIPIPAWLAGTWQAKSELVIDSYDHRRKLKGIESPVEIDITRMSVIGTQQDKLGQIWHYVGTPFKRTIKTGDFVEVQKIESLNLKESSSDKVIVESKAMVVRIEKRDRETLDLFKEETVTTYTPIKDGVIQVEFLTRDYDLQGKPTFSSSETCIEKRIERFHEVNQDERGDLVGRFRQFLLESQIDDRLER